MILAIIPLQPADPAFIHVLRIRAAISSGILLTVTLAVALFAVLHLEEPLGWLPLAIVALWSLWNVGIAPRRRWAALGHAYTGEELHAAFGLYFRTYSIMPINRVQSIDILDGPIERMFGLSSIVLKTAGHDENAIQVPGLKREDAQEILLSVRDKIGIAAR